MISSAKFHLSKQACHWLIFYYNGPYCLLQSLKCCCFAHLYTQTHTCTRTRILAPTSTTNIYIKNDSKNRPDSKIVFLTSSVQFCEKSFIFFRDNIKTIFRLHLAAHEATQVEFSVL